MKKFAGIVAAVAMAFTFAACSGDESAAPTETVTVTAEATPAPEVETPAPTEPEVEAPSDISDADFANLVRENTNVFDGAPDSMIVDAAKSVCGVWETGGTINDVIEVILASGVNPEDGGFLAGAGTQAYCPEYADQIPGGSNA